MAVAAGDGQQHQLALPYSNKLLKVKYVFLFFLRGI